MEYQTVAMTSIVSGVCGVCGIQCDTNLMDVSMTKTYIVNEGGESDVAHPSYGKTPRITTVTVSLKDAWLRCSKHIS